MATTKLKKAELAALVEAQEAANNNPFTIREKIIAGGKRSLRVDFYYKGKREIKTLGIYLLNEATGNPVVDKAAREVNKGLMKQAQAMADAMFEDWKADNGNTPKSVKRSKLLLADFIDVCVADNEKKGKKYRSMYQHLLKLLIDYKGNVKVCDIDKQYCLGFIDYLKTAKRGWRNTFADGRMAQGTQHHYLNLFKIALNKAVLMELIAANPFDRISSDDMIKLPKVERDYLTIEELEAMKNEGCAREDVERIFLFACYTGLRISDIEALTWSNVETSNGVHYLSLTQKKRNKSNRIKLSQRAMEYLPNREGEKQTDKVFKLGCTTENGNLVLKKWAEMAGVEKKVSWHVARHTFATMMLTADVDLYTVSTLLGHNDIKTTAIYAKIVDNKKDEAIDKLDKLFINK